MDVVTSIMVPPAAVAAVVLAMYWIYPVPLLHGYQLFGGYIVAGLYRRFLHLGDFSFCYYDRPAPDPENATTVVFLHGFTSNKTMWMIVSKYLPKEWRIVVVDLPGHGESSFKPNGDYSTKGMVKKLRQFIEGLELKQFHLAGISLGALISAAYASQFPEELKSLILMCPPGLHRLSNGKKTEFIETMERTGEMSSLLPKTAEDFQNMIELVLYNSKAYTFHYRMRQALTEWQRPHYKNWREMQHNLINGCEEERDESYIKQMASQITTPTLIVWGKHDKICHPSGAKLMSELIQNSKVVLLERCGHTIAMDRPRKCATILKGFIGPQARASS